MKNCFTNVRLVKSGHATLKMHDNLNGAITTTIAVYLTTKKSLLSLFTVTFLMMMGLALMLSTSANGQSVTVCSSDTVVGAFGVDGDLYANTPSSLNPLGIHDDWFENLVTFPGPGIGVIGTTAATSVPVGLSAAQFRAIISNPASDRNRTYQQRMYAPPLTPRFTGPGVGYLLLDAVAARDNHTAGSAKDSSAFTAGSDKNGANPNTWMIGTGGVQQKNDLIDAGGHIRREYNFITDVAGDLWGYAFATTRNTSGDAHTDFEIFRTAPEIVGTSLTNTGPDGGHTAGLFNTADGSTLSPGDVLVAVDYANGGTNPQASVRIWIDPDNVDGAGMDTATLNTLPNRPFEFTGVFDGGTGSGTYGYAEIRPLSGSTSDCLFWSVTNSTTNLGTPWGSLTSQNAAFSDFMDPLQCVSVAINFSAFGLDLNPVQGPCFNLFGSLMVKSRSSGSFTSEMKDFMGPFVFGNFQEVNGEITGGGNLSCQTTSVKLFANTTTPGASFTWSVDPGSGGNILVNYGDSILVDAAGCYVLEVANPSLASCTVTDTLCVIGTPDTDPPSITCPPNNTYSCIQDVPACPQSYLEFLNQGGSASDPSGIDTALYSVNCGPLVGGECGGTYTRVFTVSDNCGNTASCTQTIGVNDNIPPVVTNCPPGGNLGCNPLTIPAADTSVFQATDNCLQIIKSWSDNITGTPCNMTLTRTYMATDSCNNSVTCQQVFNWVEDLDPPTATCPGGGNLGCNPLASEYAADDAPTWSDACGTPSSGVIAGTPSNTQGCTWSVTHKYWATDACLNTDTCYQTFTWTVDMDPPTASCPSGGDLGCNPLASEYAADDAPTWNDACGTPNSGVIAGTPSNIQGCSWFVTHKYWATDVCLNTDTCYQTYTWTVDNDAPTATCPSGGDLGCNPLASAYAADDAPTWSDACGGLTSGVIAGTPSNLQGCIWGVTHKYWATDVCLNTDTCYQTFTWTVDTDAPTATCPTGGDLGCNPLTIEYAPNDAPTWSDACGGLTSGVIAGIPSNTQGCTWSVTHKYWATDVCLNTDTCYQTFTWTVDTDAPTATCPSGGDLGCNPLASLYAADDAPTWSDACGGLTSGVIAGTPSNLQGCIWGVTHKYWATDVCLNTDTCYQTFTWTVDLDAPTATCPTGGDLGCNPLTIEYAPNDAPTWSDACGTPNSGVIAGTPSNLQGCIWGVTHKYWATDVCLNTDTCYQTFTWTVDLDAPTATCPTGGDLGCNPLTIEYAPNDAPTWSDACGTPNSGVVAGIPAISQGCYWSVTHKYWATDACLNTDTCYQTFTWKVDNTPPTIVSCAPGQNLGCNPGTVPAADTSLVQATDNCDGPLVVTVGADIPGQNACGATLTRIYTVTDACGNTATCSQVFTYTVDIDPPTAVCPGGGNLGCNPAPLAYAPNDAPTWSDACSAFTSGVVAGTPSNTQGCTWSVTHKYWATDACLNTDTCYQTFTWTVDLDAPTASCPAGGDLGCNPLTIEYAPNDAPTWSDACGGLTSGVIAGTPSNLQGCIWGVTHKYWATDVCLNTDTCYQTFTWTVDLDAPTATCPSGGDLGCNPLTIEYAPNDAPTWSDACGTPNSGVIAGTPSNLQGCIWGVTHKYWATDVCLNTDTCYQTFTWTVDLDAPTATCPTGGDLGCNPLTIEYAPNDAPTWSDACGTPNSGVVAGIPAITQGCYWSVTHKYWATDACLNTDTCYQTFTWKVDNTPPTITKCAPGQNLGCNPGTIPPADTTVIEAVDNCDGTLVVTVGADIPGQNNCGVTITRIYTVTDACGNTATCSQVFTYTVDIDPPTAVCPGGGNLGCNPAPLAYAPNDAPTWSDACSAFNSGVIAGTPSNTQGCTWTVTHKYWATDACLNTDTCYQTFTWTVDLDAPTATCPSGGDLGCNPLASEYAADDAPTWSDACGGLTSGVIAGTPSNLQGCIWGVTHKYWATDVCLNTDTCYQTFTWTVDMDPPTATCPTGGDLGCNPLTIEYAPNDAPTWSDACSAFNSGVIAGTPSNTQGCTWTVTHKYWATDACLNTDTCYQTFTWTVDLDAPTASCPAGGDLGCNPLASEYAADDAPTWSDACGGLTSGVIAGTPSNTQGCTWSVTHKYWATDVCLNTDTCYQTFTWTVDTDAPTANCPTGGDLGCNPAPLAYAANDAPTWSDACGTPNSGVIAGTPSNLQGCTWSVTHKYWATDVCLNTDTCYQTFTWTVDMDPPTATCPTGGDLGCNPLTIEYAPNDAPTWSDACGTPSSGVIAGTPSNTQGCMWSVTHKYWATDACLNTDTCYQTFTWKVDNTPPVFTYCPPAQNLGCNPTSIPGRGEATATDNCSGQVIISAHMTPVVKTGCDKTRSRIYTATDACGNTATCEQVFTWRVDKTPPVVDCGKDITVCNGTKITLNPTAIDDCDGAITPTCTRSDGKPLNDPFPVGVTTVTCSATDGCNNTGSCSINVTVIDIPTCTILTPIDLPICTTPGNTISANVNNADPSTTYQWSITTNDPLGTPWVITGGQGTSTITYTAGSGVATFNLIVTNSANGVDCESSCDLLLPCLNDRFCTYTQGFYGNKGGKACNGEDTDQFLIGLLSNPLVIGGNGNTLTLTQADVISGCFFTRLPGGGWSKKLSGAATCKTPVGIALKNGKFRNTLLNQTITLGLNLRITGSNLDNLALNGKYLTTYASTANGCDDNGMPIPGTAQVWKLPGLVLTYLGANNTVGDLYALANQALAGTYVPGAGQPSLSAIAKACDIINNAFDECRMLGGFSNNAPTFAQIRELPDAPNHDGVTMNAYPNPFNEKASIEFKLDGFDSDVLLEVFTLTGSKVATLYNAFATADETYKVEFDASTLPPGVYIYQLNTGDKLYNEKLVLIK